jgi:hypothetical protein
MFNQICEFDRSGLHALVSAIGAGSAEGRSTLRSITLKETQLDDEVRRITSHTQLDDEVLSRLYMYAPFGGDGSRSRSLTSGAFVHSRIGHVCPL